MQDASVTLHGRKLAYRRSGDPDQPPTVLVHGITQHARTWDALAGAIGDDLHLLAPDLPGHGRSAAPPGDHSMGGYAAAVRDLLLYLGHESATLVGHSLGGGVALQFAYQFPHSVDRLVLVDSGGLGRDVSPLLRAATLPGAWPFISVLSSRPVTAALRGLTALRSRDPRRATELREVVRGLEGLADPEVRHGFLRTVRTNLGWRGQRVSATDRLYLAALVPTLIIWGERDSIIPVHHGYDAHRAIAGSRLEVLPDAGHFPHVDDPRRVARLLLDFVGSTEAAALTPARIAAMLRPDGASEAEERSA